MYIVEVVPLATLPPQVPQLLSYFFDWPLVKGAMVQVPIGKRQVKAIVVAATSLLEQKIAIKKSAFQLKKIASVLEEQPQVSAMQLKIAAWLATTYYASLGLCLKSVLPSFFGVQKYSIQLKEPQIKNIQPQQLIITCRAGQEPQLLRSKIEKAIKEGSVLLLIPDRTALDWFVQELNQFQPLVFHSGLTNAEQFEVWEQVQEKSHLIIGTRTALGLPFLSLALVAATDSSHEFYISDMTPRYHTTELAQFIARAYGAELIFTTVVPSVDEYHQLQTGQAAFQDQRTPPSAETILIDRTQEMREGNPRLISRQMEKLIVQGLIKQEKILVISPRKGYTTSLICGNCGTAFNCPNCSIPLRTHKDQEKMLVCYRCSFYGNVPSACQNCRSTALLAAGQAGSQKIKEELQYILDKNRIAGVDIFIFDTDMTQTEQQEQELLAQIEKSAQPIIVATQVIFSHRYTKKFDLIALPNADGLVTSVDFRTEERFLQQFEKLLDFEPRRIILQSYQPSQIVFQTAPGGTYKNFYSQQLSFRKAFSYPPYSRLAYLAYGHRDEKKSTYTARVAAEKLRRAIVTLHLEKDVQILGPSPALIAKEKNIYRSMILLKINPKLRDLDSILRYVPSDWRIEINPRNLG